MNTIEEEILAAFEKSSPVDHICDCPLPHLEAAGGLLGKMRQVLFPGYFEREGKKREDLRRHLTQAVEVASSLLSSEIEKCLRHAWSETENAPEGSFKDEAATHTAAVISEIPKLIHVVNGDIQGAYLGDPAATGYDEIILAYPGFQAVLTYRIAHLLYLREIPLLPRILAEYAHSVTGIDIHPGARIGRNFFIDHGTGVVIGETTEVGDNVKLYQGVTLGALSFPTDEDGNLRRGFKRHPTIEDDVVIYSNASILGPVRIGRGSAIGGNVFLTHDVEPESKVTIEKPEHRIRRRTGISRT